MDWPNDAVWQVALIMMMVAGVVGIAAIVGMLVNLGNIDDQQPNQLNLPWGAVLFGAITTIVLAGYFAFLLTRQPARFLPAELFWRAAVVAGLTGMVAIVIALASTIWKPDFRDGRFGSGFAPTAPIMPSAFALAVFVMMYAPSSATPEGSAGPTLVGGKVLLSALVISMSVWVVFAIWRGRHSTAQDVAPELYESLKTDYLALCNAVFPDDLAETSARFSSARMPTGMPAATDAPLPLNRILSYLIAIGREMGFVEQGPPDDLRVSPRAWNTGTPYLEAQRRMAYVRDSLVAHEPNQAALQGHVLALELRMSGANMGETKAQLTPVLASARENIEVKKDPLTQARSLYMIAATMSSMVYTKQKSLVRVMLQQHWLVVVVQLVTIAILAIAVLARATADAIGAGGLFYLIGAGSGILSLLHVRQSIAQPDLGEDYGLLRVELARAFTLSGLAAIIAVFLVANLSVIAQSSMFDPATPTPTVATNATPTATSSPTTPSTETPEPTTPPAATETSETVEASPEGNVQPVTMSYFSPPSVILFAQDPQETPEPTPLPDDEVEDWRSLGSIFSFENLAGLLVALVAGWIPERLFRSLTSYGNRLRYDIQSMSQPG